MPSTVVREGGLKKLLRPTEEEMKYQDLLEDKREKVMEEYNSKQDDKGRCLIVQRISDTLMQKLNPASRKIKSLTALQMLDK